MNKNIWLLLGLGGVAYYIWYMNNKKKDSIDNIDITKNQEVVDEVVQQAKNEQKNKFTNAFLLQYNIKVPPIQASKMVKDAALKRQDKRYAKQIESQLSQPKVYL
jgi:hypothetical protein